MTSSRPFHGLTLPIYKTMRTCALVARLPMNRMARVFAGPKTTSLQLSKVAFLNSSDRKNATSFTAVTLSRSCLSTLPARSGGFGSACWTAVTFANVAWSGEQKRVQKRFRKLARHAGQPMMKTSASCSCVCRVCACAALQHSLPPACQG